MSVVFGIRGPIAPDDLPGLCDRVCRILAAADGPVVICEVDGVAADAVAVDALCRLQLAARRRRCEIRLRNAGEELLALVALMGLTDVLPDYESSRGGSPKRGKSVSVSRKNVSSPTLPPRASTT
jgi:ABC-type transporter Mla MlaB component